MARPKYPALAALKADLDQLDAAESFLSALQEKGRKDAGMPPHLERVSVPWLPGRFWWMDQGQRNVVRILTEALGSRATDVDERHLVAASGRPAGTKLRDVFAGPTAGRAWGELVLPGARAGTCRLRPPPAGWGEEPEGERRTVDPE